MPSTKNHPDGSKRPLFAGRAMNHRLVIMVYQVPDLSLSERHVLMALAEHANGTAGHKAYPSIDSIARRFGTKKRGKPILSRRTVIDALRALSNRGLIMPRRTGGGRNLPNLYDLNIQEMLAEIERKNGEKSAPFTSPDLRYPSTLKVETVQISPETVQILPGNGADSAHEQESRNKNQNNG